MGQPVPDDDLPGPQVVPDADLPSAGATTSPSLKTWTGAPEPGLESTTPVGYGLGLANGWLGGELQKGAKWLGVSDPNSLRDIGNIPQAAEAVFGGRVGKLTGEPAISEAVPHPLDAASTAEQARLSSLRQAGTDAGLDLPDKSPAEPQLVANDLARRDLDLPAGAPLTPQMLTAARRQFASPAYQAVEKYPEPIPLSDATRATIDDVKPLLPAKLADTLPSSDTITGQQAVNFSQVLRNRANQLDKVPGANASGQLWSEVADAHRDAAVAIENDVRSKLTDDGNEQMADDWNNARIYTAKTYTYQHALDGAGNVRVPDLKRQMLNGKPLSDQSELLAHMGAQYPEMFRPNPAVPQPSMLRRAGARVLPAALGAAGSHLGPFGAALGVEAGENLGKRLLGQ
jgi:hypothetical protein